MALHDYVIDNGTGAAVRADINLALLAIVSLNASSTAPSTTYAYQLWADTNTGILKIRNSGNSDWIELLQLDGTLTMEDGSASAPGLAFRDDLDTGIFQGAANDLRITTAGSEVMRIENTTVGIGASLTSVPRLLTLKSATQFDGIKLLNGSDQTVFELGGADSDNDTGLITLYNDASQIVQFNANGVNYIKNTLGLVVGSDITARALGTFVNTAADTGVAIVSGDSNTAQLFLGDATDFDVGAIQYANSDNTMRFTINTTERMILHTNGGLFLGVSTSHGNSTAAGIINCAGISSRQGTGNNNTTNAINWAWNASASPNRLEGWVDNVHVVNLDVGTGGASDYRIKDRIKTISYSVLDKIKKLRPVQYNYKDYKVNDIYLSSKSDFVKTGFIAHEVQEVIPSAVKIKKDDEQLQEIDLVAVVSTLTKGMQELIDKVNVLESELALLKGN
jgi:hypothetical protein